MKKIYIFAICLALVFSLFSLSSFAEDLPLIEEPSAGEDMPGIEEPSAGEDMPGIEEPSAGEDMPGIEEPSAGDQPFDDPMSAAPTPYDDYITIVPGSYDFRLDGSLILDFINVYVDGSINDIDFVCFEIMDGYVSFYDSNSNLAFNATDWDATYNVVFNSDRLYYDVDCITADQLTEWFNNNFTFDSSSNGIISSITSIFSTIASWLVSVLLIVVSLFWTSSGLSFFGILALVALGIALFFLLIRVVQNFLRFRS